MERFWRDLHQAGRSWSQQPLIALVALVTLTLAIGANVSIFALVRGILLRPPPFPDAERLVFVWNAYPRMGLPEATISVPDYLDRRAGVPEFEATTLFHVYNLNLTGAGVAEQLRGLRVTPSFFAVYGLPVAAGRALAETDAQEGAEPVVVLAHALFQSHFAADPELIGQTVALHGVPHRVVGVTPPDFLPPFRDIQFYVPFVFTAADRADEERGREYATMVARLAPGATIEQATARCEELIEATMQRLPENRPFFETVGFGVSIRSYVENLVGEVRPLLLLLQMGTLLLLAVAAVNLAHMVLARTLARTREMAVRTALGAQRSQLAQQLWAEGLILAVPGSLTGLLIGTWGLSLVPQLGLERLPRLREVALDGWVLAFTLALGLLTALAFTIVPLWALPKSRLAGALQEAGGNSTANRRTTWLRGVLVVTEVALAMALLTGSLLLVQSFTRLREVDPGFSGAQILTASLQVPDALYPDDPALADLHKRLRAEVAAVPGVRAAGLADFIPFGGGQATGTYLLERPDSRLPTPTLHAYVRRVDEHFFTALDLDVGPGRAFDDRDHLDSERVCLVDQFFVDRQFGGRDPTGRHLQLGGDDTQPATIIGVVPTIRHGQLALPIDRETIYFHAGQGPPRSVTLVIRTVSDPTTLIPDLQEAIRRIDPDLPLFDFRTLEDRRQVSLGQSRAPAVLMSGFGWMALFLCGLGLYGTLAFAVSLRRREIGIRLALGATHRQIQSLVLGHGLRLAGVGVILGCGLSALLAASWQDQLFGVSALDPHAFALAALLVLGVTAAACWWPARRATHIEPLEVMRKE